MEPTTWGSWLPAPRPWMSSGPGVVSRDKKARPGNPEGDPLTFTPFALPWATMYLFLLPRMDGAHFEVKESHHPFGVCLGCQVQTWMGWVVACSLSRKARVKDDSLVARVSVTHTEGTSLER